MYRIFTILFLLSGLLFAQGVSDPLSLPVYSTDDTITVDGVLDEAAWSIDNPYLLYRINGEPSGNGNTPTGNVVVKGDYVDTTTTEVKFLFSGMDLFISLNSDDHQVCRFGDSWEGDGLFMKITDASGSDVEFKLYFNSAGVDQDIVYEGPEHSTGAAAKGDQTTVNDSTNVDNGYTAELHVSLEGLGFTAVPDSINMVLNIFDPDNYSDGVAAWGANGNFAKEWWGSEWGDPKRSLKFDKYSDPQSLMVTKTDEEVVLDGALDEAIWSENTEALRYQIGGISSENMYSATGSAIVKSPYTDNSTTIVKFTHDDTCLYISLDSDDQQVCRFGDSWEGDGLFMKIKDASGSDVEYKLYYNLAGVDPEIHYEGPDHSTGASMKGSNTVVNDSTNVDDGYTAELRINFAGLGFSGVPDSLQVLINIFDPDNYSDGVAAWGSNGSYAKQWWGSEWGPDMRTLYLETEPVAVNEDPAALDVAMTFDEITVDGLLDEQIWAETGDVMQFQIGGNGSEGVYTPTGYAVVKGDYTDVSTNIVSFVHDGDNLYIAMDSDDQQVCRFGDSWEGDGLFMKIKDASGSDVEYKLYFNLAGVDPEIHYEGPAHSEGAGVKGDGTVVNDSTNIDGGYTAELRISLSGLGFTTTPDSLSILFNVFDPDNYSDGVGAWGANGSFAKQWWGSEWGPEMRTLYLDIEDIPVNEDPASLDVLKTNHAITVDGTLDEDVWSATGDVMQFEIGGNGSEGVYTPTGYAVVKGDYTDVSTNIVRFVHDGDNLYISMDSDDQQVCRFGDSWEGDGLFMKIKDASGTDVEYKLYFNSAGVDPDMVYEGPEHSEGAGAKGEGTIVNDSTNVDGGYTAELRISLSGLGFATTPDSLSILLNVFDPDNYSDGVGAWGANGNYAKQWWGSEWGPEMRTLYLTDVVSVEDGGSNIPTEFQVMQNYPNPFNPTTTINFRLPERSKVKVDVFNSLGVRIATLAKGEYQAGSHKVVWNGKNTSGLTMATGIYFFRVKANNQQITKKMLLVK